MLRQLYYGKSWSVTSRTSRWDNVIPCSPNLGHPGRILGNNLFEALRNSAVVQGVDVGHVFTGLEAMTCPRRQIVMSRLLPLGTVRMDNEAFATWGGDVGAAAAAMVACWDMSRTERARSEDCGYNSMPMALTYYFSRVHAPPEDLEGDIAPFVMRAAELGISCRGSMQRRFNPTRPISQIFAAFYNNTGSRGRTHRNRYQCFAEIIGAQVVGNRIQNRRQLIARYAPAVASFAEAFYAKIMMDIRGYSGPGTSARLVPHGHSVIRLNQHTVNALNLFFNWLQARL